MTTSRTVAIGVLVLGMIVLAVASILPRVLPTSLFWTDEQAREQAAAASRLHQVTHQAAHTQISTDASDAEKLQAQQELEAASARYDASRNALDRAQFWRRTVPMMLRWSGGSIALIGVFVFFATADSRD